MEISSPLIVLRIVHIWYDLRTHKNCELCQKLPSQHRKAGTEAEYHQKQLKKIQSSLSRTERVWFAGLFVVLKFNQSLAANPCMILAQSNYLTCMAGILLILVSYVRLCIPQELQERGEDL